MVAHAPSPWITSSHGDSSAEDGLRFVARRIQIRYTRSAFSVGAWRFSTKLQVQCEVGQTSERNWYRNSPGRPRTSNKTRRALDRRLYSPWKSHSKQATASCPPPQFMTFTELYVYVLTNWSCGGIWNQPTVTAKRYFVRKCCIKFIALRFSSNVSFFDKAKFHLNRYNRRIWSSQPPQVITEHWGVRPKVGVWCGMMTDGINGPLFL
jgi:hypothetical protein